MQKLNVVVLFLVLPFTALAQHSPESGKVAWLTLDEAAVLLQQEIKPLLIDLYTDWCGWCKVMDRKTYSNKKVGKYLNDKYYSIKINAEDRRPIMWKGRTYQFNNAYKTNDFALFLTRGNLSYPTTVILPADQSAPQTIPGYLTPKDFEPILKYFGDNNYGEIEYPEFYKNFKSAW